MQEKNNIGNSKLLGRFRGKLGFIVVAIVAFFLGALFFGGNGSVPDKTNARGNVTEAPTVWTCSMHPHIKLPKPGKCPICFMNLIPLVINSDDEIGPRQLRLSETAKQLAQIQTTPVRRSFASAEIRMVGKIVIDETRLSHITAWFPGRLDRLYANFTGMSVKRGDHLAEIYSPELYAAEEELIMASRYLIGLKKSSSTSLKQTAAGTLKAAREKLRLWGLTVEQIKEIEKSGRVSDQMTIYAPSSGVVVQLSVREGMYVKTGTRIYSIADLSRLWVIFEAYESDLPWLRYRQKVVYTSPSFPGEQFSALISFIDPLIDPKTRTVKVRAVIDNKDMRLKPDMFVRGIVSSQVDGSGNVIDEDLADKWISPMHPEEISDGPGKCGVCGMDLVPATSLGYASAALSDKDAPLLIPASAPMITGKRAIVYVEIPNDKGPLFEGREVLLGPRAGDFYVVKSGLEEGELVVTNGAFKIDSELQIQAKPSMMSPEGGASPPGHHHEQPSASKTTKTGPDSKSVVFVANERAVEALSPIYHSYFNLQTALASDNLESARKAGNELIEFVNAIDMSLFSRSGHALWMELSKKILTFAAEVSQSGNIDGARQGFSNLSEVVIDLEGSIGHADDRNYYLTFCPMANNNNGAHWLQTVDTVYNSFYGASMLRCGEIKKSIAPRVVSVGH